MPTPPPAADQSSRSGVKCWPTAYNHGGSSPGMDHVGGELGGERAFKTGGPAGRSRHLPENACRRRPSAPGEAPPLQAAAQPRQIYGAANSNSALAVLPQGLRFITFKSFQSQKSGPLVEQRHVGQL